MRKRSFKTSTSDNFRNRSWSKVMTQMAAENRPCGHLRFSKTLKFEIQIWNSNMYSIVRVKLQSIAAVNTFFAGYLYDERVLLRGLFSFKTWNKSLILISGTYWFVYYLSDMTVFALMISKIFEACDIVESETWGRLCVVEAWCKLISKYLQRDNHLALSSF